MIETKSGGISPTGEGAGRSDLAGSAAAAVSGVLSFHNTDMLIIPVPPRVAILRSLSELAGSALVRAIRAGALALEAERRGDQAGRWFYLRRKALHFAVHWAAAHPEQENDG